MPERILKHVFAWGVPLGLFFGLLTILSPGTAGIVALVTFAVLMFTLSPAKTETNLIEQKSQQLKIRENPLTQAIGKIQDELESLLSLAIRLENQEISADLTKVYDSAKQIQQSLKADPDTTVLRVTHFEAVLSRSLAILLNYEKVTKGEVLLTTGAKDKFLTRIRSGFVKQLLDSLDDFSSRVDSEKLRDYEIDLQVMEDELKGRGI